MSCTEYDQLLTNLLGVLERITKLTQEERAVINTNSYTGKTTRSLRQNLRR